MCNRLALLRVQVCIAGFTPYTCVFCMRMRTLARVFYAFWQWNMIFLFQGYIRKADDCTLLCCCYLGMQHGQISVCSLHSLTPKAGSLAGRLHLLVLKEGVRKMIVKSEYVDTC